MTSLKNTKFAARAAANAAAAAVNFGVFAVNGITVTDGGTTF